jgi:hypothetical protein
MAQKKASAHASIPHGFDIDTDEDMRGEFPAQRRITIVLSAAHQPFEVFQKSIPGLLKGRLHRNKTINWMNNFGLVDKEKHIFVDAVPQYEILLDQIENAEYVYFDGKAILALPTAPSSEHPGKVRAVLSLGDPPIGWVG